jgi:hypothetical protein
VMAAETTDNVLQLVITGKQAQAFRQRCLPHLPASVQRTDKGAGALESAAAAGSGKGRSGEGGATAGGRGGAQAGRGGAAAGRGGAPAGRGGVKSRNKPAGEAAAASEVAKRRRHAWIRFLRSKKAIMEREEPGVHFIEVQKQVAAMWAQLTLEQKDEWAEQSESSGGAGGPPAAPPVACAAGLSSGVGPSQQEPSNRFPAVSTTMPIEERSEDERAASSSAAGGPGQQEPSNRFPAVSTTSPIEERSEDERAASSSAAGGPCQQEPSQPPRPASVAVTGPSDERSEDECVAGGGEEDDSTTASPSIGSPARTSSDALPELEVESAAGARYDKHVSNIPQATPDPGTSHILHPTCRISHATCCHPHFPSNNVERTQC